MRNWIGVCLAACLTASCATSPVEVPVVVHEPVAVLPDDALFADCTSGFSNGSIGAELQRLSALVNCERANNAAGRAWKEKVRH